MEHACPVLLFQPKPVKSTAYRTTVPGPLSSFPPLSRFIPALACPVLLLPVLLSLHYCLATPYLLLQAKMAYCEVVFAPHF